jgi:single-strand DNA-binding protein
MSNLNQVILQGNLVDAPQLVGEEKNVARFTIAVNNGFGDYRTTTFVDCVSFGKQAEVIAKHFTKGKQVIVRGTLVQNRWEDKEGNKRSKLEVRLENVNGFFFTGNASGSAAEAEAAASEAPATVPEGASGENLF